MEYLSEVRSQVRDAILAIDGIKKLMAGNPDPQLYVNYLINVWHYAQHSATVIGLAGARCVKDHPKLADYLLHHAQEELGHEQWALDDLGALDIDANSVRRTRPVPACAAMIGYEYYVAGHANPVGLFGWLFVLESMGDDLGGLVSAKIAESLDLPSGVKFLRGHGVADEEHTKDIIEQIESNIDGADLADVHHVADVVGDLYVRMFNEIEKVAAK